MIEEPPPAQNLISLIIIAVLLIVLSMLFSAAESAFLSVNKLRVRYLRQKRNRKASRVGKLLDNRQRLINAILIGNCIANIALTSILTSIALELFGNSGVAYATLASTVLLLIFGEILPKSLGATRSDPLAYGFSGLIYVFYTVFRPLTFIFEKITGLSQKILKIQDNGRKISFSEEDIKTLMDVGEEEGILESAEKTMMTRVFKFTDMDARDIMQPRTAVIAVDKDATIEEVIELSRNTHRSRFPVYENTIDHICGMLYMKDVLLHSSQPEKNDKPVTVKKLMRDALFIPESKKMTDIQKIFRQTNQSIAVVLGEYSETAGILTVDDIASRIFGPLEDFGLGTWDVPGTMHLHELEERYKIQLVSRNVETVGGFICEKLGRIPQTGDSVLSDNWRFTVTSMDGRRVAGVHIDRKA